MGEFGDDFNIKFDSLPTEKDDKTKKSKIDATESNNKNSQSEMTVKTSNYNLSNAAHPFACIATISLKVMAIFFYLFIGNFTPNVVTFIVVLVINAFDFWVVKNVTGRLLIGLRWWTDYNDKGNQVWKFQSFDQEYQYSSVDKAFFWTGQLVSTAFWGFFFLIKVLSLSPFWALLDLINLGLSFINLYGYYKCRGSHLDKLKSIRNQGFGIVARKILG